MNGTTLWLYAVTETVLALTPGPAVLYVLSSALRAGARRSVASTLAILTANNVYFALSATSLGTLLVSSYRLFFFVKWIGAAYLVFLGVQSLIGKRQVVPDQPNDPLRSASAARLFWGGFVLQMSNPKALVFFTAIMPQFIDARLPLIPQIVTLGVITMLCEFSVLTCYGIAAGRASALARQPRYAVWTARVSGGLLIGAGAGLALLRRD